jgi:hypothetical protein
MILSFLSLISERGGDAKRMSAAGERELYLSDGQFGRRKFKHRNGCDVLYV